MNKVIAFLLLAFVTLTFAAGTAANLTWTAPTTYSDGTALAPTDIAFYTVTWGTNTLKVNAPA